MGKLELVIVVSLCAIAAMMIMIRLSTNGVILNLPKFSRIVHISYNDNWPTTNYQYGDIVTKVNKSGIVTNVYIIGSMGTKIELTKDEIYAFEKIYNIHLK